MRRGVGAGTCASTRRVAALAFPIPAPRHALRKAATPRCRGSRASQASEQRPPEDAAPRSGGPAATLLPAPRTAPSTLPRALGHATRPTLRPAPSAPLRSAPAAPAAARTAPGLPVRPPRPRPIAPPPVRSLRSRPSVGAAPGHAPASRRPSGWGKPAQPHLQLRRHQARPRPPPAHYGQGRASRPQLRRNPSPQPLRRWGALAGSTFPVFLWR